MDLFDDNDEELNIDLTPLIDVVFMLLIFFIMTTTFSKPVMDIILPKAEVANAQNKTTKEILVSITKTGAVFYKDKAIDNNELTEILNKDTGMLNVYVDKNAPFEAFIKVIDIAKKEREGRFVISTEKTH